MNYQKIYNALMNRARDRVICEYFEKHHVKPKCLGGTDSIRNLVQLTPEEHYVAHQLLVKLYPRNKGLMFAVINMSGGAGRGNIHRSNKLYGWLRRRNSNLYKGKPRWSDEIKRRIGFYSANRNRGRNHPMYGRKHSKESRAKMSAAQRARPPISEETRYKMSASYSPMTAATKRKIVAANRARAKDPKFLKKLRLACRLRARNNAGIFV